MNRNILLLLLICCACKSYAQTPATPEWAKETPASKQQRMQWWTNARFGMFIHWGLYALPARHEWVMSNEKISIEDYRKYFNVFDPDLYNPREWAKMAKAAGMKYVVITAKHHEGFCLWDSKYTDYKATNTPAKKDLLKMAIDAFREEGIRIGIYYSLLDWHHPGFPADRRHPLRDDKAARALKGDMPAYRTYMKNQITELLTNYGQIDEFFLDFSYTGPGGKARDDWHSEELLQLIRKLQPQTIVNDRLDLDHTSWGWDYKSPEQFMPQEWPTVNGERVPWETNQTFSGSWGYSRDENTWKSPRQLLEMLIEVVSKGGNLLLNVGPTARGNFDERANTRLNALSDWMKYNNKSIYGCTQAPDECKQPDHCLMTYNPVSHKLYLHVLEWPFKSVYLRGFKGKVAYAQFLHDASEVKFHSNTKKDGNTTETTTGNDLLLEIPVTKPNVEIPVIEITLIK